MTDDGATKAAGIPGRNAIGKKYPGVGAFAGAGNFQRDGDAQFMTRLDECPHVVFPFGFVEIDG